MTLNNGVFGYCFHHYERQGLTLIMISAATWQLRIWRTYKINLFELPFDLSTIIGQCTEMVILRYAANFLLFSPSIIRPWWICYGITRRAKLWVRFTLNLTTPRQFEPTLRGRRWALGGTYKTCRATYIVANLFERVSGVGLNTYCPLDWVTLLAMWPRNTTTTG